MRLARWKKPNRGSYLHWIVHALPKKFTYNSTTIMKRLALNFTNYMSTGNPSKRILFTTSYPKPLLSGPPTPYFRTLTSDLLLLLAFLFLSIPTFAQPPAVAKPQTKPVVLVGGTAHVGNGQVIENAVIAFDKGKLTAIAAGSNVDRNAAEVIDITGKHVYPGLIAPNTQIGLNEISAVKATQDNTETGEINANVRSLVAYNTDSEHIPVTRSNGVLLVQIVPDGGVVSGTSSVVQLDAWNWEDAAYRKDDGMHLSWPALFSQVSFFEPGPAKKNEKRNEILNELNQAFNDGMAYAQLKNQNPVNLKLEAMRGLYDGTKTLFIRADYGKEIMEAVQFAQAHGVKKVAIVGASDAWMITDFLKENNVSVVLNALHRLPSRTEEDVDMPFKLPAILHKAGIVVGITYDGAPMQLRNLPFLAGQASGHGLSKEEALMLVTANNAKILGIDQRTGTLEVGKDANIVVSSGDLLDMRTNDVTHAFIQGRNVSLDNKQKRLYKRFSDKYDTK